MLWKVEMKKISNIFTKASNNSSYTAEIQLIEAKTFKRLSDYWLCYTSLETGCNRDWATNRPKNSLKNDEAQTPKCVFENKYFKNSSQTSAFNKQQQLGFKTSRSRLDLLLMRLCRNPTKNNKFINMPKLQTISRDQLVQGTINIKCYLQELYIITFSSFWH